MTDKLSTVDISVLVICYNQRDTLGQTLDSVLAQRFTGSIEIIIADDHSLDGTQDIIETYCKKNPDIIRRIPTDTNIGLIANYTRGVLNCKGEYFAQCAGDDFWSDPQKLQEQYEVLRLRKDVSLIHTGFRILEVETDTVSESILDSSEATDREALILKGNFISALTIMVRTQLLRDAIAEGILKRGFLMEDYPLWLYAGLRGTFAYIPKATGVYRRNAESLSNTKSIDKRLEFELSTLEIRRYMAPRYYCSDTLADEFSATYRSLLYRGFVAKNFDFAKRCFLRLRETNSATFKDYLAGFIPLARLIHFGWRIKNKLA